MFLTDTYYTEVFFSLDLLCFDFYLFLLCDAAHNWGIYQVKVFNFYPLNNAIDERTSKYMHFENIAIRIAVW